MLTPYRVDGKSDRAVNRVFAVLVDVGGGA
jgi:hypothetical protein